MYNDFRYTEHANKTHKVRQNFFFLLYNIDLNFDFSVDMC
jgi:hypothetical protein